MPLAVAAGRWATDRVARDRVLALRHWGVPCSGQPVAIFKAPLPRNVIAQARYTGSPPYTACAVVLARRIKHWPTLMLCSAIAHEYGHLVGRRHSHDPRSVMFPRYVRPFGPCRREFPHATH